MLVYKDQLNRTISLGAVPKRIVTIVPSQTELLYHLGLGDRVVGITKFCIHPDEWFKTKERIGGTKNVDIVKVKALQPDLIIANKEENEKENVLALEKIAPVWFSDIYNLEDSYQMIQRLGELCGVKEQAEQLVQTIHANFETFDVPDEVKGKSVLYLIWRKPYMGVATNTFIDFVLTDVFKLKNVLKHQERYPEVEIDNLNEQPNYIFLSSEPYPFKEKHMDEIRKHFPLAKIVLVDGEYFSWYGSRLKDAPNYFTKLSSGL